MNLFRLETLKINQLKVNYTMKKVALNLIGLALLPRVFGACNDDDDNPEVNLIIKEWVAAEGQFTTFTVDGEEK